MTGSPATRLVPDLPPGPRAALVIATTSYHDPELSQLRATADDAQALTEVLGDPGIGGFTITSVTDVDERQVRRAIDVFLSGRGTGDVVLVYLSCHGVLDRRNRLYFAATDTVKDQLSSTGVPASWLLEQLEECRARQQVVILDCCFSGAFAKGSKGDGELDLERRLAGNGRGRVVLTASRSGEYSFTGGALSGAAVSGSVFTAGLVEGLRTGAADASGDGYVSVDEAYDFAYRYVLSLGAAQTPQRWLSGGEGTIVLARNPAGIAFTPATLPVELADALESRYPTIRIGAVHELGSWLASDDPGRALSAEQKLRQIADNDNQTVSTAARAYLADPDQATAQTSLHTQSTTKDKNTTGAPADKVLEQVRKTPNLRARFLAYAERAAGSLSNEESKASTLSAIAQAAAPIDPARAARLLTDAERIAQSITDTVSRASALRAIAEVAATTDPRRAERIAKSIPDDVWDKKSALRAIAEAAATTDPRRAERIAQSITDAEDRVSALSAVAQATALTDPARAARLLTNAERIAQSITDAKDKASALSAVAQATAPTDPARAARLLTDAERAAESITNEAVQTWALRAIAVAAATADPARAERIAQSIPDEAVQAWALRAIAVAAATADPARAERIAQSIPDHAREKESALSAIAHAAATTDTARAERNAQSITNKEVQASALSAIAQAAATTDPARAERIAQSITDARIKATALSAIVQATT